MIWCGRLLGKNNGTKDMMWVVCCVLVGFCLILHERNTGLVAPKSRTSRLTSHICLFLTLKHSIYPFIGLHGEVDVLFFFFLSYSF